MEQWAWGIGHGALAKKYFLVWFWAIALFPNELKPYHP
jgi:hypothetical protein